MLGAFTNSCGALPTIFQVVTDEPPFPAPGRLSWTVAAVLLAAFGSGGFALGLVEPSALLVVGSPLLVVAAVLVYLSRARRQGTAGIAVRDIPSLGQRGVVLPYSAALGWGYVVGGGYCALFFGLIAVGGAATGPSGAGEIALLALALVVEVYLLWCLVDLLRGRLGRGFVALTPDGICHRSWAMWAYLPWDEVASVTVVDVRGPLVQVMAIANTRQAWSRRTSLPWKQGELAYAPDLAVQGRFLTVNPALLYRAVRFYGENPAGRAELATDAAATRIRDDLLA